MVIQKQRPGREEHIQEETLNFGSLGERQNNTRSTESRRDLKDGFKVQLTWLDECLAIDSQRFLCWGAPSAHFLSSVLRSPWDQKEQPSPARGRWAAQPPASCFSDARCCRPWAWLSYLPGAKAWAVSERSGYSQRPFNCQAKLLFIYVFIKLGKRC